MSIISPADGFMVTTPEVVIQGTASDSSGVAVVDYVLESPTGTAFSNGSVTGTTAWTADVQGLVGGTNLVLIRASDIQGNVTVATVRIYFFQQTPLTVTVNGAGTVEPNLNGKILESGKSFKITEKPAKGYVFAGWTGDVNAGDTTLYFIMRSNMVLQANFAVNPFPPAAGTYSGAVTPTVPGQLGGPFKVILGRKGKFFAKFKLGDEIFRLSGTFLANGSYSGFILRKKLVGNVLFSVQLQLDMERGEIAGTVTNLSISRDPTGVIAALKTKRSH